jgi:hypothetical protein
MLVVDLHCAQDHRFEGWFASADDLASQKARGLLTCPVCGDHEVVRLPSAPHLNVSSLKADKLPTPRATPRPAVPAPSLPRPDSAAHGEAVTSADVGPQEALQALQAMYLQAVKHVVAHTEDVGDRFADEARSIHHGDAPERAIRGQASPEEKEALREEGIDVLSLPIPEGLDGPLQ